MQPLMIRSGRNPYEVCLSIGLALISLYGLLWGAPSVSLDNGLTQGERVVWGMQGLAGAIVTLAGIYWRPMLTGLYIERAGQLLLGFGAVTYVVVLCGVSTFARSGLVVTIASAIAVASVWRFLQITAALWRWRKANQLEQSGDES